MNAAAVPVSMSWKKLSCRCRTVTSGVVSLDVCVLRQQRSQRGPWLPDRAERPGSLRWRWQARLRRRMPPRRPATVMLGEAGPCAQSNGEGSGGQARLSPALGVGRLSPTTSCVPPEVVMPCQTRAVENRLSRGGTREPASIYVHVRSRITRSHSKELGNAAHAVQRKSANLRVAASVAEVRHRDVQRARRRHDGELRSDVSWVALGCSLRIGFGDEQCTWGLGR